MFQLVLFYLIKKVPKKSSPKIFAICDAKIFKFIDFEPTKTNLYKNPPKLAHNKLLNCLGLRHWLFLI